MNKNIKAILFDFDGTLAHLTIDFARMRELVLAELSDVLGAAHPALARRELPVMEMIYAACKEQDEATVAAITRRTENAVSAYEVEAASRSNLFPYVEDLLKSLKKQNIATAIVTRNCRAAVEKVFPHHAALCGALVSRGDIPPEALKPNPGQLLAALEALNHAAGNAVMVGDHPMDVTSGKAAGCYTAGVLCGNAKREAMEAASPDWLAEDTEALFRQLKLF